MREFSPDSPLGNPHRSWQVIASIGAGLMAMLSMWFFIDDALPYFAVTEESYGRFWHRTGWLLSHVVGGSLALLSGPVQLWSGISRRHLTLHRWSGRLYVLGATLGAITALQLAFNTESWTFGVALFVGGVIWLATTAMGLVAVLQRRIKAHREWMQRSYTLTFTFVIFRLLLEIPWIEGLGTEAEVSTTIGWLCWLVPLLVLELSRRIRNEFSA